VSGDAASPVRPKFGRRSKIHDAVIGRLRRRFGFAFLALYLLRVIRYFVWLNFLRFRR
jgi:hypothetical protein